MNKSGIFAQYNVFSVR